VLAQYTAEGHNLSFYRIFKSPLPPNAIKLRLFTSPFEKGGLRGILYFNDLNPPYPPFSKGGFSQEVTVDGITRNKYSE